MLDCVSLMEFTAETTGDVQVIANVLYAGFWVGVSVVK